MKKILFLSMVLFLFAGKYKGFSQEINQDNKSNIPVPCLLKNDLKTIENKTIPIVVVNDTIFDRDGNIFIQEGAPVKIKYKISRRHVCGIPCKIKIYPKSTVDVDGNGICLSGKFRQYGKNRYQSAIGCGVGFGLTILPGFGFLFLCIKGKDIDVPARLIIPSLTTICDSK